MTLKTGVFSLAPTCVFSTTDSIGNASVAVYDSVVSQTSVLLGARTFNNNAGAAMDFKVVCTRQGNDYLSSSSSVYSQTSSNYDWRSCGLTTSDFTNFGTVTNINMQCSRQGGELVIRGSFTGGTASSAEGRIRFSA